MVLVVLLTLWNNRSSSKGTHIHVVPLLKMFTLIGPNSQRRFVIENKSPKILEPEGFEPVIYSLRHMTHENLGLSTNLLCELGPYCLIKSQGLYYAWGNKYFYTRKEHLNVLYISIFQNIFLNAEVDGKQIPVSRSGDNKYQVTFTSSNLLTSVLVLITFF